MSDGSISGISTNGTQTDQEDEKHIQQEQSRMAEAAKLLGVATGNPVAMYKAISAFQAKTGLPVSGIATSDTLAKLKERYAALAASDPQHDDSHDPLSGVAEHKAHGISLGSHAQHIDELTRPGRQFITAQAVKGGAYVKHETIAKIDKLFPSRQIGTLNVGGIYDGELGADVDVGGVGLGRHSKLKITHQADGYLIEATGESIASRDGTKGVSGAKFTLKTSSLEEAKHLTILSEKILADQTLAGALVQKALGQPQLTTRDVSEVFAKMQSFAVSGALGEKIAGAVGANKGFGTGGGEGSAEIARKLSIEFKMNHGRVEKLAVEQELTLKSSARAAVGAKLGDGSSPKFTLVAKLASAGASVAFNASVKVSSVYDLPRSVPIDELVAHPETTLARMSDDLQRSKMTTVTIKAEGLAGANASAAERTEGVIGTITCTNVHADKIDGAVHEALHGDLDSAIHSLNDGTGSVTLRVETITQEETKLTYAASIGGIGATPLIDAKIRQPIGTLYDHSGTANDVLQDATTRAAAIHGIVLLPWAHARL